MKGPYWNPLCNRKFINMFFTNIYVRQIAFCNWPIFLLSQHYVGRRASIDTFSDVSYTHRATYTSEQIVNAAVRALGVDLHFMIKLLLIN